MLLYFAKRTLTASILRHRLMQALTEGEPMKLVIATIQDQDTDLVITALTQQNFRVTRIGSTGGFLGQGNTTLLIGVEDHQVENALTVLKKNSQRRTQYMPLAAGAAMTGTPLYNYLEVEVGGVTAFVLDVLQFEQI
jgi:uncharacterized protein YaaQ